MTLLPLYLLFAATLSFGATTPTLAQRQAAFDNAIAAVQSGITQSAGNVVVYSGEAVTCTAKSAWSAAFSSSVLTLTDNTSADCVYDNSVDHSPTPAPKSTTYTIALNQCPAHSVRQTVRGAYGQTFSTLVIGQAEIDFTDENDAQRVLGALSYACAHSPQNSIPTAPSASPSPGVETDSSALKSCGGLTGQTAMPAAHPGKGLCRSAN